MQFDGKSFARGLLGWYDHHRRRLPWRESAGSSSHPYYVLLSEFMLQQTQVSTVLPYFDAFVRRFATLPALARATDQQVLQLWQGLGYYSRARNLLAASRQIVAEHGGMIPKDVPTLLTLRGVGRYTAGAIASIAYDTRAPIVDGNVARVLCRIDMICKPPQDREVQQRLWHKAQEILPKRRCGDFNSALMELGATVCTPRAPKCDVCPVAKFCEARKQGRQLQIPPPRQAKPLPLLERSTFCLGSGKGRMTQWLIEQRPAKGRWAGMWQFLTSEATHSPVTARTVKTITALNSEKPRKIAQIEHTLSHRQYRFDVYLCDVFRPRRTSQSIQPRRWVRLDQLHHYPLPRPHVQIAQLLRQTLQIDDKH